MNERIVAVAVLAWLALSACPLERMTSCPEACGGCCDAAGACKPAAECGTTPPMPTCTPKTCADFAGRCGPLDDGCGGSLACGCEAPERCGEGGVCGQVCESGCPTGSTCDGKGVCSGTGALTLDVKFSPVRGRVTWNGRTPTTAIDCAAPTSPNFELARVVFEDVARGQRVAASLQCQTGGFAFSADVPHGTYRVRVERGANAESAGVDLPSYSVVARDSLEVNGPIDGLVLDAQVTLVAGKLRVNGSAPVFAARCAEAANSMQVVATVAFTEPELGYVASATVRCSSPDAAFATSMPLGRYEVRVKGTDGWSDLPSQNALLTRDFEVRAPVIDHLFDVRAHRVSGFLRVNGATPQKGPFCTVAENLDTSLVVVELKDSKTGVAVTNTVTCRTPDFAFAARVPEGTYDVRVRGQFASERQGSNLFSSEVLVQRGLEVKAPISGLVLDEVNGVAISGLLRVDGMKPQLASDFCDPSFVGREMARVTFIEKTAGHVAAVPIRCGTNDFSFAATLPVGTYEVRSERLDFIGERAPMVMHEALVVDRPRNDLVLDRRFFSVAGKVTRDGMTPTTGAFCQEATRAGTPVTLVELRDTRSELVTSTSIWCGNTGFTFSTRVPPGTYEVWVRPAKVAITEGVTLPYADAKVLGALEVRGPVSGLSLDVPTRVVVGRVTVSGQSPMRTEYCQRPENAAAVLMTVDFTGTRGLVSSVPVTCAADFSFVQSVTPEVYGVSIARGSSAFLSGVPLHGGTAAFGRLRVP